VRAYKRLAVYLTAWPAYNAMHGITLLVATLAKVFQMSSVARPIRKYNYPWKEWFKRRKTFRLKRGKHFDCQPHSMVAQIRKAATKYKVSVSVQVLENTIAVTATTRTKRK
jgi:hypothetical protein